LQTQAKLRKAKMDLTIQESQQAKDGAAPVPAQIVDDYLKKDKDVHEFQKRIAQQDYQIEQMKQRFIEPEKERAFQQAVAARDVLRKDFESWKDKVRSALTTGLREEHKGQLSAAIDSCKAEIELLEKQDRWLADEVDKRVKSLQGMNKRRVDVEWLRDEIALADDLVRKMGAQLQILQVEKHAPPRFQTLEEAYSIPDKDGRLKKSGMAGGGVFALVVFAITFLEFRSRRLSSVDEVVRGLRLKLVGTLPSVPRRARAGAAKRPKDVRSLHQLNESVDSMRTTLLHAAETDRLRVVLVTSAVGGEGKTMTSSHLAVSLARAGRNVLLIDADLRRPALQKLFGLALQPGLSELLRGETDAAGAVQPGPVAGLSVMCAGASNGQAIQALSQPILRQIFDGLRGAYDFIVVDSAPVLPVADSQLLGQQADGVILSVLRDVSRLPQVYAAYERLAHLKVRILGAVMNGADGGVYGSSYEYGQPAGSSAASA
jgi:capsular exopolysaccharide synthesis family protein